MRRLMSSLGCAALVSAALASPAAALEPGTVLLALEATSGTADLVAPGSPYLAAYDHGEVGAQVQGWYLISETTAFTLSGGIARAREANRVANQASRFYQQRAWSARAGLDRMIAISDDALLYFGPGLEYWTGHANFIGYFPEPFVEAPEVRRWSASGRFGAMMVLTDSFGLTGHIGYRMGYATASRGGADTGWYTNGYEATAGVAFAF